MADKQDILCMLSDHCLTLIKYPILIRIKPVSLRPEKIKEITIDVLMKHLLKANPNLNNSIHAHDLNY